MKLNREQIIKALECCSEGRCQEEKCPLFNLDGTCEDILSQSALSLIKQLTEDVERVSKQCGEIIVECDERDAERLKQVADLKAIAEQYQKQFEDCYDEKERYKRYYFNHCFDELRANVESDVKADTLMEMQNRLAQSIGTYTDKSFVYVSAMFKLIERIAKEMLEGNNE